MKRHFILFALAFAAALSGVAKTFDVDISTGRPAASNEAYYHGETIEFRAVRGRTVVTNIEYGCIYYQTNGMDSVWWKTDGLTFHPTNDVGAASYRFFLEGRDDLGRDWHANGLLRLLPSPGFTPNEIELPVARLDFANIEVANAPYYDKAETEAKIVELAPAPGNYAAVSNAAMNAVQTETDPVWNAEKSGYATTNDFAAAYGMASHASMVSDDVKETLDNHCDNTNVHVSAAEKATWNAKQAALAFDAVPTAGSTNPVTSGGVQTALALKANAANVYTKAETDAAIAAATPAETDPTVPAWAKAVTKPSYTAAEVGAVSSNKIEEVCQDNAQTRQIVMTWETFLGGSNVVFAVTNYISGAYSLDAAKLRIQELRDGEYQEVYNSRDEILLHINDFSNRYVRVALDAIVDEVAARLASKADRDWGKYTSAGGEAPSNTVYMTAPNTVFAGGLEYERVAVGEGTICVLTTRGAPVWTQGDEGTFKFQDDGGTNYFGFAKTDSYTIGANTDGITVQSGMVTMNYNITMSGRPCVWYKSSLSSGAWEQLNLPDGSPVAGASHAVTWEANPDPGTQVCYINVGNAPSGFFKATVEVTGEAKFMTNMPADLSGGIISTNTATGVNGVIKPSFNGSSVIWTWSAN